MSSHVRYSLSTCIAVCAASFVLSNQHVHGRRALTQTFTIGGTVESASPFGEFTLPAFDPTLGTLQSIDLTLSIDSSSTIKVYNTASTPVGFTNASINLPLSVSAPSGITFTLNLGATLASGTAQPGLNTFGALTTNETLSQSVGSAAFALFEDQPGGTVTFSYNKGNPTYQGTDLGNSLFFGGSETGSGELKIVYTYLNSAVQPTPEPAGMYLSLIVALALAALAAGRAQGLLRV